MIDDNMKKTGLYIYVFDFSVNYDRIDVVDILNIYKYLLKKHDIKNVCIYLKKVYWIVKHLHNETCFTVSV